MLQKSFTEKSRSALLIRFSSFGDIVQTAFTAQSLKEKGYTVDLLTKTEFAEAFKSHFPFSYVRPFNKKNGLKELWEIAKICHESKYSLFYDAHNNQRTLLFKLFLILRNPLNILKFKTRSKFRLKRFFLFKLRWNFFPKPFKGALSFLSPLGLKAVETKPEKAPVLNHVLLAPSAAWDLKKWPAHYWIELANKILKDKTSVSFIGGPGDHFISEIFSECPGSKNLSGVLSWSETIQLIKESSLLISGDTGVLHVADYYSVPAIGLMGPSAFGFPTRDSSLVLNKDLPCQPCSKDGRGKCKLKSTKKCLTDISPTEVYENVERILK